MALRDSQSSTSSLELSFDACSCLLDPPGAPRIDGYNEGDMVRENKSVTLICVSRGGNPLADLTWFRNDVRLHSTFIKGPRETRHELSFIASTKDNLARYRCEAVNVMSVTPKIADVTLTVMCKLSQCQLGWDSH